MSCTIWVWLATCYSLALGIQDWNKYKRSLSVFSGFQSFSLLQTFSFSSASFFLNNFNSCLACSSLIRRHNTPVQNKCCALGAILLYFVWVSVVSNCLLQHIQNYTSVLHIDQPEILCKFHVQNHKTAVWGWLNFGRCVWQHLNTYLCFRSKSNTLKVGSCALILLVETLTPQQKASLLV